MNRQAFSSFFISAAVCSGLLATNGFSGQVESGRWVRSRKLGVEISVMYKLVPLLSLLVMPRCASMWVRSVLKLVWIREPSCWSRFTLMACC
jgi:hypothetical protein